MFGSANTETTAERRNYAANIRMCSHLGGKVRDQASVAAIKMCSARSREPASLTRVIS